MGKKVTHEQVKARFEAEGYTLISDRYLNNIQKLKYICPENHLHETCWAEFSRGKRCPSCANAAKGAERKVPIERVRDSFELEGYTLLTHDYVNSKAKLLYRCDRGHEHSISWNHFNRGGRCPSCDIQKRAELFRLDENIVRDAFEREGYQLLSSYVNANTKVEFECPSGHKHQITWGHFQSGKRCRLCFNERRGDTLKTEFSTVLNAFQSEEYQVLTSPSEFKNNRTKIKFICPQGHHSETKWLSFQQGNRCKFCSKHSRPVQLKEVEAAFEAEGYILLESTYQTKQKLRFICPQGHIHDITWNDFSQGHRCGLCAKARCGKEHPSWDFSKTEEERQIGRDFVEYEVWRKTVYKRDRYTCQSCNQSASGSLVAHHLYSYDKYRELRLDTGNGVTLCKSCHTTFHNIYGRGNNTKEQFLKFLEKKNGRRL